VLLVAAVVCEGIVEYLIAPWFDKWEKSGGEPVVVEQVLRLVTAVLGIAAAWQLDLPFFRTAFGVESLSSWFDLGVTGIAIGRGSNYIHDRIGRLRHQL
jgi:hypothetical protein